MNQPNNVRALHSQRPTERPETSPERRRVASGIIVRRGGRTVVQATLTPEADFAARCGINLARALIRSHTITPL